MAAGQTPDHIPAQLVRDFNFFDFPGAFDDVYAAWRRVQETEPPVFYSPWYGGSWIVMRADLLNTVWADANAFSAIGGVSVPPLPKEVPPLLPNNAEGSFHRDLRKPLMQALSPKAVQELRDVARALTIELIENIKPRGECEFVSEFSLIMPMEIFLRIVNLPSKDRAYLLSLTHVTTKSADEAARIEAMQSMGAYLERWIQERMETPGDDAMSKIVNLIADGRPLTDRERIGYVTNVMFGGLDTVGSTMSLIAKHLAEHPADRHRLAANPGEIPAAIEELLRRYSIPTVARVVARDMEFGGVSMKKGDRVMMPIMLHGLDETRWPDAMTVDLHRRTVGHSAFGSGAHHCPGANLARAELKVFLEEWLKRIPDFSIKEGEKVRFATGQVVGLASLPLVWPMSDQH